MSDHVFEEQVPSVSAAPGRRFHADVVVGALDGDNGKQPLPPKRSARQLAGEPDEKHAQAMVAELGRCVGGEVRFDAGSRALYATDASNYRQTPIGVVIPESVEDIVNAVAVAHRFGVPVLARGGGTGLAGQCCNAAVVIDCSKYLHHILELDPKKEFARVRNSFPLLVSTTEYSIRVAAVWRDRLVSKTVITMFQEMSENWFCCPLCEPRPPTL